MSVSLVCSAKMESKDRAFSTRVSAAKGDAMEKPEVMPTHEDTEGDAREQTEALLTSIDEEMTNDDYRTHDVLDMANDSDKTTRELLQAQHEAMLRLLESWLASQEDRLSQALGRYAHGHGPAQPIARKLEGTSAEDLSQGAASTLCKEGMLYDDAGVVTATASLSSRSSCSSSGGLPSSSLPSPPPEDTSGGESTTPTKRPGRDFGEISETPRGSVISGDPERSTSGVNIRERLQDLQEATAHEHRCRLFKAIVVHPAFEGFFAFLIVVNAVTTCLEVNFSLESATAEPHPLLALIGHLLGFSFLLELVLRVAAYGRAFLSGPGYGWNIFDLFLVASWCAEFALEMLQTMTGGTSSASSTGLSNMRLFRILRITRMFRLLRIARILRFVRALNLLVLSILTTLRSLVWASILLLLIIFTFAIFICQSVADSMKECEDCTMDPQLKAYWGTLPRAALSLFQIITGGKDWDDVAQPLLDLNGFLLVILIVFIIFSQFAVLNVVTGVFCQAAVESAQRDRELMVQSMVTNKQRFVDALGEQFTNMFKQFSMGEGGLTFKAFESHMHVKSVREYFALLELDTSDAWMLFKLLDDDGSGIINVEEFVDGCLRLKGTARSIDLAKLSMEFKHISQRFNDDLRALNGQISDVQKAMDMQGLVAASHCGGELLSVVCAEPTHARAESAGMCSV
eukprot:TRINITY_DN1881_c0_g4_i1.p1 TRINITY_DN1881_c0_g4~~TRINITY_DN1881_c0_g4_i1.p1  ORF type:complete len:686 (+),score=100.50 TRINITY_DN1881_c0_g4_i1:20-2077(+)